MPRPKAPKRTKQERWRLAVDQCEKEFEALYGQPWNPDWKAWIHVEHRRVVEEEKRAWPLCLALGKALREAREFSATLEYEGEGPFARVSARAGPWTQSLCEWLEYADEVPELSEDHGPARSGFHAFLLLRWMHSGSLPWPLCTNDHYKDHNVDTVPGDRELAIVGILCAEKMPKSDVETPAGFIHDESVRFRRARGDIAGHHMAVLGGAFVPDPAGPHRFFIRSRKRARPKRP
jgi:hypothetical protein